MAKRKVAQTTKKFIMTDHHILFLKLSKERISYIENLLDTDTTPAPIKLLLYKEMYTVFAELQLFAFEKINTGLSNDEKKMMLDLKDTVTFTRHILAHFPLFNTWDDIWITKEFAESMYNGSGSGTISKFLNANDGRKSYTYKVTPKLGLPDIIITIRYPEKKKQMRKYTCTV